MPAKFSIQELIHALEQGKFAPLIRGALIVVLVITLTLVYLFVHFRGFNVPDAMDQAQIARSIAAGEGYSTRYIRPLAMWQLEAAGKKLPSELFPDFFHQPLNPLVNAIPMALVRGSWEMQPDQLIYAGDRAIAGLGILFFLASVVVVFFIARILFDNRVAIFGCAAVLVTDLLWQFSLSGLPHMLMLFLFSLAVLFTLLAMVADIQETGAKLVVFLALAGLCFGLMTLAHGLAFWVFLGWLVFAEIRFYRRLPALAGPVLIFLVAVSPWMLRNYQVCGNPMGLAGYTFLWPGDEPERVMMRSLDPDFRAQFGGIRTKVRDGVLTQASNLFSFLGLNIVAAAFFFSLLHPFKNVLAAQFRWAVLLMWGFTALGIAIFGIRGSPVASNQLHVLFIPLMVIFGMAFLLVLFGRLAIREPLLRGAFMALVIFLAAIPMLVTLFAGSPGRIQWPPYIPPFIAVMNSWFEPEEILSSDMPWAIAWYAQRKCLLLPESPRDFTRISDYRVLGRSISGLYLTPITGNQPLVSQIYRGAYREWAQLITRPPQVRGFPLSVYTPLPLEGECIIFSDRDRWSAPAP